MRTNFSRRRFARLPMCCGQYKELCCDAHNHRSVAPKLPQTAILHSPTCPATKCSATLRADSDTCVRSFYDVAFYHYSSAAPCRKSRAVVRKTIAAWRRSTSISQIFTVQLSAKVFKSDACLHGRNGRFSRVKCQIASR